MNSFTPYGTAQPVLLVNADPNNPKHNRITKKKLKTSINEALEAIEAFPKLIEAYEKMVKSGKKEEKKDDKKSLGVVESVILLTLLTPVVGGFYLLFLSWVFSTVARTVGVK